MCFICLVLYLKSNSDDKRILYLFRILNVKFFSSKLIMTVFPETYKGVKGYVTKY